MARVIGDGGITLYVQDVIVHLHYQGQGIGKKLMTFIMNYIRSSRIVTSQSVDTSGVF